MSGIAIITEACIDVKDRACVDVCPVQCIYEYDPATGTLFSEEQAGAGIENTHQPNPDLVAETVRQSGWKHLYLHIDLDVLEPSAFASLGWPEPGGLRPEPLRTALQSLYADFNVVGGGLTEYLPVADSQQAQRDDVAALEILDVWSGLGRLNEQR